MATVKFKGETVKLTNALVKMDEPAPNFLLVTQDLNNVTLDQFSGKKKVLWVVPSLDTGVCLTSAKKLNDIAKRYPHIEFLIVSADLPFAQKRICGIEKLSNIQTLSSMRDQSFGHNYGLLMEEGPLKGLLARAVVFLDEEDRVRYLELVEEVTNEPNYDSFEKALR